MSRTKATKVKAGAPVAPMRGLLVRKGGASAVRVTSYMTPDLATRLRVRAAELGRPASEIVSQALGEHLGSSDTGADERAARLGWGALGVGQSPMPALTLSRKSDASRT